MSHWGPHPLTDRYNPTLGFGQHIDYFHLPHCSVTKTCWLKMGNHANDFLRDLERLGVGRVGRESNFLEQQSEAASLSCPAPHITSDLLSAQVNLHSTLWIVRHFVDLRIAQKSSILTTTICISPYLHLIFFCSGPSSVFCSVKCWGFEWVDFLYFRFFIFCICT